MKQPELEAESLAASVVNGEIQMRRRTHGAGDGGRSPSPRRPASRHTTPLPPGHRRACGAGAWPAQELGLYRLADGALTAVAAAGPLNPREVADMRATEDILKPLSEATEGGVHWLVDGIPQVRQVSAGANASGSNWIGLVRNNAYRVTQLEQKPLLPQWATLLILASALLLAWRVEGR